MISIVIDTNVVISAIVAGGHPLEVLGTVQTGQTQLLITEPIIDELRRTLSRPKFAMLFELQRINLEAFIANYVRLAQLVSPVEVRDCALEDPHDLKFIECAVGGGAKYIVSGDYHLLSVRVYKSINIVTPAQFLTLLQS